MKFAALFAALFLLSACSRTPEERASDEAAFQSEMPAGCTFHDLGSYSRTNHNSIPVVAVVCNGRDSVTVSELIPAGKTRRYATTVTITE